MFARTTLAAALIAALSLLGACSDDDKDPAADPSPSERTNTATEQRVDCEAEVAYKGGKTEGGWSGKAFAITENRSGPVQYRTEKGKASLAVFGEESEEQPAFAMLKVKGATYTGTAAEGLTIEGDPDGAGAEVDGELNGMGALPSLEVTATITC